MLISIRDVADEIRETAVWVRSEAANHGALRGDLVDTLEFASALRRSRKQSDQARAGRLSSLIARRARPLPHDEPKESTGNQGFDASLGARIRTTGAAGSKTASNRGHAKSVREPMVDLEAFCANRIGYGSIDAPYWFLGAEEGFTGAGDETLRTWLAEAAVEDLYVAHTRRGQLDHLDQDGPKLQPTWGFCIRLLLEVLGRRHDRNDVLRYQVKSWGRRGGETLLAELMPLPNHGLNEWLYAPYGLPNRATYEDRWRVRRVGMIRELILEHRPRFVVAYTKAWWDRFREVFVDASWVPVPAGGGVAEVAVWNRVRVALIPSFVRRQGWNPSPELVRFLRGEEPGPPAVTAPSDPVNAGLGPFVAGHAYILRSVSTYAKDGDIKVGEPSMAARTSGKLWPEGTVVHGLGGARVRFADGTEGYCDANKIKGSWAATTYLGKR